MRLLNTHTLELDSFVKAPPYAILSHTWEDGEILFDDVQLGREHLLSCTKAGLAKILDSCEVARNDGWDHIWIDTCCIDKSSSAELSEAINSMFLWYAGAQVCYVFLEDCSDSERTLPGSKWSFKWCSRGWTLQELVAPYNVHFYNAKWEFLGNRHTLADQISACTGIDKLILRRHRDSCPRARAQEKPIPRYAMCFECHTVNSSRRLLDSFSVATRMSWVSRRETTREEDMAYCILGIFNVHLPLLYGEGCQRAFNRLQEAIVNRSNDQSILVWGSSPAPGSAQRFAGLCVQSTFAISPASFRYPCEPVPELSETYGMFISGFDLVADVLLGPGPSYDQWSQQAHFGPLWLAFLNCNGSRGVPSGRAIILARMSPESLSFQRVSLGGFTVLEANSAGFVYGLQAGGEADETMIYPFDATKFTKERIHIQLTTDRPHLPYSRGLRRTTPPVTIQISNLSPDWDFQLTECIPSSTTLPSSGPVSTCCIPPSPYPFKTKHSTGDTAPFYSNFIFGALALRDKRNHCVVVLCGISNVPSPKTLSLAQGSGVDIHTYIAYEWWQGPQSTPFCIVMSWESLATATGGLEGRGIVPDLDQRNFLDRVIAYSAPSDIIADSALEDTSRLDLEGGLAIIAKIQTVDFLQRKSVMVSVEIS
ncbi:heterokaryon incompatibility protein-domain-containing protein [Cercophora newfieldiana]|uniref:Heterokaryon incompatibility protein-domain-containing protein n=1 Tax=Cercophora newfieldiana TaxID=92897 RepID=A0AA39Y993_9PEZI|nr:heterokaryon incompatibility protein-domain-containing protein [Cercophora newfieldiana]